MSFDLYKKIKPLHTIPAQTFDSAKQNKKNLDNSALKGVLLNNHIKNDSFEGISNALLIPDVVKEQPKKETKEDFNYKKALKPLAILTLATLGTLGAISSIVKKYSGVMAKKADLISPPDIPLCNNIVEEYHLAMYRLLRQPNGKNFLGLAGVGAFSAVALIAKNFIDGSKEVWIKKQNCDIERDLQEKLIQVETEAFSGKINIINSLLKDTSNYFKQSLNFKGKLDSEKEEKTDNKKLLLYALLGTAGLVGLSFAMFKNYQKTAQNLDIFEKKITDKEIRASIENAVALEDKNSAIQKLKEIFKLTNANNEKMSENLKKIQGIDDKEIQEAIQDVERERIYVQAPEALGGVSNKIQYYCYVNEERGHLYNWILNPESKFNKYLFLSFCLVSSIGYLSRSIVDAIKTVTVSRENAKSELNLRKRLVEVEIENFRAKKLSALNPLLDNYKYQMQKSKNEQELKELAENILIEIKNGPPYVYA